MNKLLTAIKSEPALLAALGTALGPVLGLCGVPMAVVIALGGLAAAVWAIVVRMMVTPVGSATTATQAAALNAAAQVASGLDTTTAGAVGVITDKAATLIATAAAGASGAALRNLGVKQTS